MLKGINMNVKNQCKSNDSKTFVWHMWWISWKAYYWNEFIFRLIVKCTTFPSTALQPDRESQKRLEGEVLQDGLVEGMHRPGRRQRSTTGEKGEVPENPKGRRRRRLGRFEPLRETDWWKDGYGHAQNHILLKWGRKQRVGSTLYRSCIQIKKNKNKINKRKKL